MYTQLNILSTGEGQIPEETVAQQRGLQILDIK